MKNIVFIGLVSVSFLLLGCIKETFQEPSLLSDKTALPEGVLSDDKGMDDLVSAISIESITTDSLKTLIYNEAYDLNELVYTNSFDYTVQSASYYSNMTQSEIGNYINDSLGINSTVLFNISENLYKYSVGLNDATVFQTIFELAASDAFKDYHTYIGFTGENLLATPCYNIWKAEMESATGVLAVGLIGFGATGNAIGVIGVTIVYIGACEVIDVKYDNCMRENYPHLYGY